MPSTVLVASVAGLLQAEQQKVAPRPGSGLLATCDGGVVCHRRLGGLLKHYRRAP